jgi:hypothetical protein
MSVNALGDYTSGLLAQSHLYYIVLTGLRIEVEIEDVDRVPGRWIYWI